MEVQADTLALEAEMAEARAEVERSGATLIARRQALGMVEGEILQRVPTLRRMAEDAYREGHGGTLELLDASRSLKDIQLVHVRQLESFRLGGHSRRRRGTGYHANSVGHRQYGWPLAGFATRRRQRRGSDEVPSIHRGRIWAWKPKR